MDVISGMFTGLYTSLSNSVASCCPCLPQRPHHHHDSEKSFTVLHEQPSLVPPPSAGQGNWPWETPPEWEQAPHGINGSKRSKYSMKRRLLGRSSSSRRPQRPQISGPSNFRHLYSESLGLANYGFRELRPRPRSFRPLELSIYQSDNQLSPILPHFDYPNPPVTPPQRAVTQPDRMWDSPSLSHARSYSSLSFHVPRKPINNGSVFDTPPSESVRLPAPAKLKDSPSSSSQVSTMDDLVERVASAMLERDRLQQQIDDVVERQSIYVSSRPSSAFSRRPSTARSVAQVIADMEPMPEIPALPPDAPSFSERLSSDRPITATSAKSPIHAHVRARPSTDMSSPSTPPSSARPAYTSSPSGRRVEGRTPPPPLPLRLRPPLRKKKSFSNVSSWLGFPTDQQHNRGISLESITTHPKPVSANDGFYEVAAPGNLFETARRSSSEYAETVSDWTSDRDAEGSQTVPTSWSPGSATIVKAVEPPRPVPGSASFVPPHRASVGVAF